MMKRTTSAEDKAAEKLIRELQKSGILVKAYNPQFKKDVVMITSKGVKVKDFLNAFTELDKGKKDKHADLFLCKPAFLVDGNKISKIEGSKIMKSDVNELNNTLANYRGGRVVIDNDIMKALKKELGNFDISL